jgi:hypothetical protein
MLNEIQPVTCRQFLCYTGEGCWTIIPDGFGTFIAVYHDAHGQVRTEAHLTCAEIQKRFDINLLL